MVTPKREGDDISRHPSAVVVGGGLAGLSAAVVLAEAGLSVDLIERSSCLGGRASSIVNQRLGVRVDRGQHVLLGCCTNLLDFYKRIGGLGHIRFVDSIAFAGGGRVSPLTSGLLPEPLHLAPSLVRLRQLAASDKLRMAGLMRAVASSDGPEMSAANWLAQSGQSKRAISSFWEPILIGALNENLDQVSHRYAAMVIRQAMLANREGVRLGLADVPLGDLHGGFAAKALEARGGGVHTGQRVTGIRCEGGRAVAVETSEGREIRADYFVAATNPDSFPLVPNDVLRSLGGRLVQSKPVQVPIASLYIWFAGRVEIPPALCIPGGSFHWCFDRTGVLPRAENEGAVLVMVASAARQLSNAPQEDILAMGLGELAQALRCKLPEVSRWTVVTCRNATFSPWVGCDSVRPMQKTAIPNLFIAGDWTATGWPGTMEGAVRSGYSCAWQILSREGICCPVPVADLPPRGLAGLFFR